MATCNHGNRLLIANEQNEFFLNCHKKNVYFKKIQTKNLL